MGIFIFIYIIFTYIHIFLKCFYLLVVSNHVGHSRHPAGTLRRLAGLDDFSETFGWWITHWCRTLDRGAVFASGLVGCLI